MLYSWDATDPGTGAVGATITTKTGATATQCNVARPDGSNPGSIIPTLLSTPDTYMGSTGYCIDYIRAARPRASTDVACASGGYCFVAMAKDAVTWATDATTHAPSNLTTAQLSSIYTCTVTNWSQVGGTASTIQPFLPQTRSDLRSTFLSMLGVTTPGACVSDLASGAHPNGWLQDNEGTNPSLMNNPNAIVPYSVADYLTQRYRSPTCSPAGCDQGRSANCLPPGLGQVNYGCDVRGQLVLRKVNSISPTVGTGAAQTINPAFPYLYTVSNSVSYATAGNHIPAYLNPIFGPAGWICTSTAAQTSITTNYGFLHDPSCGTLF